MHEAYSQTAPVPHNGGDSQNLSPVYGSRSPVRDSPVVGSPPVMLPPFPRPAAPPPYELARGHPPPPVHSTGSGLVRGRRHHCYSPTTNNPYIRQGANTPNNGASYNSRWSDDKENNYSTNVSSTSSSFEISSGNALNLSNSSPSQSCMDSRLGVNMSHSYPSVGYSQSPSPTRPMVRYLGGSPGSAFTSPTRVALPRMLPPYRPPPPPPNRHPAPDPHDVNIVHHPNKNNNITLKPQNVSPVLLNGNTDHIIAPHSNYRGNEASLRKNTSPNKYSRLDTMEKSINEINFSDPHKRNGRHSHNASAANQSNSYPLLIYANADTSDSVYSSSQPPVISVPNNLFTNQSAFCVANSSNLTQSSNSSVISMAKFSKTKSVSCLDNPPCKVVSATTSKSYSSGSLQAVDTDNHNLQAVDNINHINEMNRAYESPYGILHKSSHKKKSESPPKIIKEYPINHPESHFISTSNSRNSVGESPNKTKELAVHNGNASPLKTESPYGSRSRHSRDSTSQVAHDALTGSKAATLHPAQHIHEHRSQCVAPLAVDAPPSDDVNSVPPSCFIPTNTANETVAVTTTSSTNSANCVTVCDVTSIHQQSTEDVCHQQNIEVS